MAEGSQLCRALNLALRGYSACRCVFVVAVLAVVVEGATPVGNLPGSGSLPASAASTASAAAVAAVAASEA